ncbi:MAG: Sua5/YciO/YrdC/YwlC family protein, partial [Acidobacteriota bacterium]|nr:Sua5/YciO/YrdC/YwlC family protein [Acidobacteriota bacterium]
ADARAVLRRVGPLAVSSANTSGQPPATTVDEAIAQLGASVSVYLDGGPTPGPVASTIIDLASITTGRIVRAGMIGFGELVDVLPQLEDVPAPEASPHPEDAPTSDA